MGTSLDRYDLPLYRTPGGVVFTLRFLLRLLVVSDPSATSLLNSQNKNYLFAHHLNMYCKSRDYSIRQPKSYTLVYLSRVSGVQILIQTDIKFF